MLILVCGLRLCTKNAWHVLLQLAVPRLVSPPVLTSLHVSLSHTTHQTASGSPTVSLPSTDHPTLPSDLSATKLCAKVRFLFKGTVDLWSYINALNPIESGFFSQILPNNPEKQTKFEGITPVGGGYPSLTSRKGIPLQGEFLQISSAFQDF